MDLSTMRTLVRRDLKDEDSSDYRWQDDAGFGRIRPELCLQEAATTFEQEDIGEEGMS